MVRNPSSLIERDGDLLALARMAGDLGTSGSVALVSGEAGFGKTSLLREFAAGLDHQFQVLIGTCDRVDGPAAFAPLYELLDVLPAEVSDHIRDGAEPVLIYAELLDLLKRDRVVLIIDDAHWADEATLGLIQYIARRIDATGSLLVVAYRGEELGPGHPLLSVIAGAPGATRIDLAPLTLAGVQLIAADSDVAAEALHASTLGNPFFVAEVLRHPDIEVPDTVGEAVLASTSRLTPKALEVLRLVAIAPGGLDFGIVEELTSNAESDVDQCVGRLLLVMEGHHLSCRHELIRISVEDAIPLAHRKSLHALLIPCLERRGVTRPDIVRLAYHSVHAGDGGRAIQYSLEAAADAIKAGTHRQAALHYGNALSFRHLMAAPTLDEVLLLTAREQSLLTDAPSTAEQRIVLADGEQTRAAAHAWVAFFASRADDMALARQSADEAIEVLGSLPPSEGLGRALAARASVLMAQGSRAAAVRSAADAMAVAESAGASEVHFDSAITYGTLLWQLGNEAGREIIAGAGASAVGADSHESAVRALNNLGVIPLWELDLPEAEARLAEALQYAEATELDAWRIALLISRARVSVMEGHFAPAALDLEDARDTHKLCTSSKCEHAITRATLLGRRGDPGAVRAFRGALELTDTIGMYFESVLATARALEGAWLGLIDTGEALSRYAALKRSAPLTEDPWARALTGFWALRLGAAPPAGPLPGPVGLEVEGDAGAAANLWEKMGFPVESALTRASSPDAVLEAVFSDLGAIGADGVIVALRRRLLAAGVKKVPRGSRRSTADHPDGLTTREAEVHTLLVQGMTNSAIAERLFISERTASHHVSAILRKMGVENRGQVIRRAMMTHPA